jgi:hypothetical protein
MVVVDGDTVTLNCVTTPSRPQPLVEWYLDGDLVTDGVESTNTTLGALYVVDSTRTFIVNVTQHEDEIFCRTSNIQNVAADDSLKVTLDVLGM